MSTVPKEQFLKVRCEIPHKNIHRFIPYLTQPKRTSVGAW